MPPTRSLGGAFVPGMGYDRRGSEDTNITPTNARISRKQTIYTADGKITVESHVAIIEKGSVAAMTLAAPTINGVNVDGIEITIIAGTSFAHVVTGTDLFWAGETGGPFNKITTAAFIGSAATIVSRKGLWLVIADQIATVGD